MPLPENIDGLSPAELKLSVVKLLEEVADLHRTVAGATVVTIARPASRRSGMSGATSDPLGQKTGRARKAAT
jgi:hypothetical protein